MPVALCTLAEPIKTERVLSFGFNFRTHWLRVHRSHCRVTQSESYDLLVQRFKLRKTIGGTLGHNRQRICNTLICCLQNRLLQLN